MLKICVHSHVQIELGAVLEITKDVEWIDAEVSNYNESSISNEIKHNLRNASSRRIKKFQEQIFPQLQTYVEDYTSEPLQMESFTLVRYTEGQFFGEHSDEVEGLNRKLSIVIYLNDDYEGGEIYFRNLNLTIKPRANSLVMFPSTEEFVHEAKPVLSGTKYAITSFWR